MNIHLYAPRPHFLQKSSILLPERSLCWPDRPAHRIPKPMDLAPLFQERTPIQGFGNSERGPTGQPGDPISFRNHRFCYQSGPFAGC